MTSLYIKQMGNKKLLYNFLNIIKVKEENYRKIVYIPQVRKALIKKIVNKIYKYCKNNRCKTIVIEEKLMKNMEFIRVLKKTDLRILDGCIIKRYLIPTIIEKVLLLKRKEKQDCVITIVINKNDDINNTIIKMIAKTFKVVNIITYDIRMFRNIEKELYYEEGIILNITSNYKYRFNDSDILLNVDFSEELLNMLNIPDKIVIINIPNNISIYSKRFSGINISSYEIDFPQYCELEGFSSLHIYEDNKLRNTKEHILENMRQDNVIIKRFIGVNGIIDNKEFR